MAPFNLWQTITGWLNNLFKSPETPPDEPSPSLGQAETPITPVTRKVSLIIYNPLLVTQGNRRLNQVLGWNDPDRLAADLIADLNTVSHGYVTYQIAERILVNDFPVKEDGFAYTGEEFLRCWRSGSGFHQPDGVDYYRLVQDYDLQNKVASGAIDEVWTIGFPYAGFYESRMAGPGAFWCNAPPLEGTSASGRRYVIMAFNYERGVGEMLESYGHRSESIMEEVYKRIPPADPRNYYKRYIRYDKTSPGLAEIGTVHFAPNSMRDYDWGNPSPVLTRCRNWASFPDLIAPPQTLTCAEWGNGDIRAHHRWWLGNMPHIPGQTAGICHNWWEYIVDPNKVKP